MLSLRVLPLSALALLLALAIPAAGDDPGEGAKADSTADTKANSDGRVRPDARDDGKRPDVPASQARSKPKSKPKSAAAAPAAAAPAPVAMMPPPVIDPSLGAAPRMPHREVNWSYDGETGPLAWAALDPEFAVCGSGQRQSPIDLRDGIRVDLEPITFDYRDSAFKVLDTGHTIQANIGGGNAIRVIGRRYALTEFHFHHPGEELVEGHQAEMVVHLVHKDSEGRIAIIAVPLERGARQPEIQAVWNNLPLERHEEQPAATKLNPLHLLPEDRRYFTYMGSLTTPPCTEGVLWIVMKQPITLAPDQIELFARLYPFNARPVQTAAGRMIKESN